MVPLNPVEIPIEKKSVSSPTPASTPTPPDMSLPEGVPPATLENAHTLNIYELRQNLEFLGRFDGTQAVTADNLLRQIMIVLMEANQVRVTKLVEEQDAVEAAKGETLQERLARQKAERKAAAVERSEKRQADAAYFEGVKQSNEALKEKEDAAKDAAKDADPAEGEEEKAAEAAATAAAAGGSDDALDKSKWGTIL